MAWQAALFAAGALIFALNMLPVLLDSRSAIPLTTSLPTAFFLYLYAVAFYTMGMTPAAAAEVLGAVVWTIIALYRRPRPDD